jgi:hypothetical protein
MRRSGRATSRDGVDDCAAGRTSPSRRQRRWCPGRLASLGRARGRDRLVNDSDIKAGFPDGVAHLNEQAFVDAVSWDAVE